MDYYKNLVIVFIASILSLLPTGYSHAQDTPSTTRISGTIVDETGSPLPGVAVAITGSRVGVSTDIDGNFAISVPSTAKSLTVTFIGMKKQVINLDGKTTFNITMKEETHSLDDVVITGYQRINKRYSTSATTTLKMDDVIQLGAVSVDQMLEGKIPDMQFVANSGEVNATPRIHIRGTSTIIGNREPLWVLDGIVLTDPVELSPDVLNDPDYVNRVGNAISGINPQDILRIDVLKDAAATALYGTRAANGVIVITTKSGRIGKPVVAYASTYTVRKRPYYTDSRINLMNSNERIQFSQDLVSMHYLYPSGMPLVGYEYALQQLYNGEYSLEKFNEEVALMASRNTDWFDILCHNSFSNDQSISISGGTDRTRYYTSLGFSNADDVINNTTNRRYTAMTKLDISFGDKFDIDFNLNGYVQQREYAQDDINPVNYAYNTSRAIPAYNTDGTYYYYQKAVSGTMVGYLGYNILNELDNSGVEQQTNNIMATLNLHLKPAAWINFNLIGSLTAGSADIEGYYGESTFYAGALRRCELGDTPSYDSEMPYGGEFTKSKNDTRSYTARLQMNLHKYIGEDATHVIDLVLGGEATSTKYTGYSRTDRGYYPDRGKTFVINVPTTYTYYYQWMASNVPTITDSKDNVVSAYATLSYSFKDLFTVNGNTRYDGSNKFGSRSNEKILPIWSVSGNTDLVNVAHLQDVEWLDNLTLKASYGEQGNMLDDQTPVMVIKKGMMDAYYGEMVSTAKYFANPDLKWEKTHSTNLGLETSFFSTRLQAGVEFYYKKTTDAFMSKNISDINGYTSYIVNSGTVINKGYNVTLSSTPVKVGDFYWILSANL